jgi:hypothetical protein
MAALHLSGVLFHRGLHRQRRVAGPHRVIFMRQRRPKQGHNAIAHDLVDGAFIAMHGSHHALQHGIEELPRLFRVAIGEEFHRALEIRKQHRDLLTLPFERTAGGQDLLGQMRRRVGEGDVLAWRRGGLSDGNRALPHQELPVLIHRHLSDLNQLHLEVVQVVVIEGKLALQGPVGDALVLLEPVDDVG